MSSNESFGTTAKVHLTVPERELRQVRQDIQDGIGETPVGLTDGGTPSAQASGGGQSGRARRRARQSHRWERQRTNDIEDILNELRGLEMGEGGGGILGDVLGIGGVGADALATGIGSAVGTAVGSAVANAVADEELEVEFEDGVEVGLGEEPEWVPIEVDHPEEPYAVDHPEEPYAVDHPEEPYAVEEPGTADVDAPDSIPLDHPEDIPLDHPESVPLDYPDYIDVKDPSPLEVEPVDPIEITVNVTGGSSEQEVRQERVGDEPMIEEIDDNGPYNIFGRVGLDGVDQWAYDVSEGVNEDATQLTEHLRESLGVRDSGSSGSPSRSPSGSSSTTTRQGGTSVSFTAPVQMGDVNVDTDLDRMVDDIIRAVEEMAEELRDDYEREIDNAVDDLERRFS